MITDHLLASDALRVLLADAWERGCAACCDHQLDVEEWQRGGLIGPPPPRRPNPYRNDNRPPPGAGVF